MNETILKRLNSNQLKLVATIATTIDHLTSVIFPGYSPNPDILLLHTIGRLTTPIMCFSITEGYHYTHNVKHYASRLFLFAVTSHFAYNFVFGIPSIPFQTTIFNQTSIIWSLAWGPVVLVILQCERPWLRPRMKPLMSVIICVITFCSDWGCIAVLIIVYNGQYRGNFRRQMTHTFGRVATYVVIYIFFINPVYGSLQMTVVLAIPLLRQYSGTRGKSKGMKWSFYLCYPLHLALCGLLRIAIYDNIGVLIGGK